MELGDKVFFRKLVKGQWSGVEKQLYILAETGLKYGEVNCSVVDPRTNEKIYTNTKILVKAEEGEIPPQHLNLLTGEWEW